MVNSYEQLIKVVGACAPSAPLVPPPMCLMINCTGFNTFKGSEKLPNSKQHLSRSLGFNHAMNF